MFHDRSPLFWRGKLFCVYVYRHGTCGGQRWSWDVLLCDSLELNWNTTANKPSRSSSLFLPVLGFAGLAAVLTWVLGIQTQVSMLVQQVFYSLSCFPSTEEGHSKHTSIWCKTKLRPCVISFHGCLRWGFRMWLSLLQSQSCRTQINSQQIQPLFLLLKLFCYLSILFITKNCISSMLSPCGFMKGLYWHVALLA